MVWVLPLVAVPLIPIVGRLSQKARNYFALLVSVLAGIFAVSLLASPLPRESSFPLLSSYGFTFDVHVDGLSVFLALIVNLLGATIVLYSLGYMRGEKGLDRYYALILLFIGSMTGLVMAGNFLQLYIFWELVGICSSFLIAFWYDRPGAVRAGLKAFIVTRVGDIGLLAGLLYLYINTGTVSFDTLQSMALNGAIPASILTTAGLLVFAGAVGKSAQFPLQTWLPDAMEGPSTVSALIHAATMVNAGVYLVARTYPIFSPSSAWLATVETIGVLTALAAAPLAMAAVDVKRVLAYSTISQLGLMFAALGLAGSQGLFSAQFHLMSQGAFKALGFLAAGSVIHALGFRDMNKMGGLRKLMPVTFFAFACSAFAMAGIPPFIGFWSKDLILSAFFGAGNLGVFVLILFVSVMTSFYSFRALFKIFIVRPSPGLELGKVHESPRVMTLPLVILSGATLLLFLSQGWAARVLGAGVESLNLEVLLASLSATMIGLIPAYLVYARKNSSEGTVPSYSLLTRIQNVLLAGYGFDRFYNLILVRPTEYVASKIRGLQTGILGVNLWFVMISLSIILVVLLAWSS